LQPAKSESPAPDSLSSRGHFFDDVVSFSRLRETYNTCSQRLAISLSPSEDINNVVVGRCRFASAPLARGGGGTNRARSFARGPRSAWTRVPSALGFGCSAASASGSRLTVLRLRLALSTGPGCI